MASTCHNLRRPGNFNLARASTVVGIWQIWLHSLLWHDVHSNLLPGYAQQCSRLRKCNLVKQTYDASCNTTLKLGSAISSVVLSSSCSIPHLIPLMGRGGAWSPFRPFRSFTTQVASLVTSVCHPYTTANIFRLNIAICCVVCISSHFYLCWSARSQVTTVKSALWNSPKTRTTLGLRNVWRNRGVFSQVFMISIGEKLNLSLVM